MVKDKVLGVWFLVISVILIAFLLFFSLRSGFAVKSITQEYDNYGNKQELCKSICAEKGLQSAGYGENENNSVTTTQKAYDFTCYCLAQPMTYCNSDSDCIVGVGYCDTEFQICMPLEK